MSQLVDLADHGRKRKAPGHTRAQIFSPHLSGSRAGSGGVWAGGHATHTRQSPTLFVTNVDASVPLEQVAALFDKEPGFFAFRTVRRMCFIDFRDVASASAAMRKRQGHTFGGGGARKLLIDYDKDDPSKRDRQFAAQVAREIDAKDDAELVELSCSACAGFCLKLRIAAPRTFLKLPRRAVDGATAVETNKHLVEMQLAKGEERAIRRPGGVELQYRLLCKSCQLPVAYSSTPFDALIKHLFLLPDAMTGERKEIRAGRIVRTEQNMQMKPDAADQGKEATATAASTASAAAAASSTSSQAAPAPASSTTAAVVTATSALPEGSSAATAPDSGTSTIDAAAAFAPSSAAVTDATAVESNESASSAAAATAAAPSVAAAASAPSPAGSVDPAASAPTAEPRPIAIESNAAAVHPPAPRLVGIEPNPGPGAGAGAASSSSATSAASASSLALRCPYAHLDCQWRAALGELQAMHEHSLICLAPRLAQRDIDLQEAQRQIATLQDELFAQREQMAGVENRILVKVEKTIAANERAPSTRGAAAASAAAASASAAPTPTGDSPADAVDADAAPVSRPSPAAASAAPASVAAPVAAASRRRSAAAAPSAKRRKYAEAAQVKSEEKEQRDLLEAAAAPSSSSSAAAVAAAASAPAAPSSSSGRPSRSSRAVAVPPSHPFKSCAAPALAVGVPPMRYGGVDHPVLNIVNHYWFNWDRLHECMVQRGLLTPYPPDEALRAQLNGSAAMQWLRFLTFHDFPPSSRYPEYAKSGWCYGESFSNDVRVSAGVPYLCVHALACALLQMDHVDAKERRRLATKIKECVAAYKPVLDANLALMAKSGYKNQCGGKH